MIAERNGLTGYRACPRCVTLCLCVSNCTMLKYTSSKLCGGAKEVHRVWGTYRALTGQTGLGGSEVLGHYMQVHPRKMLLDLKCLLTIRPQPVFTAVTWCLLSSLLLFLPSVLEKRASQKSTTLWTPSCSCSTMCISRIHPMCEELQ